MSGEHEMRPECALEFGRIQTALEFHKEWREETTQKLNCIQKEIEKLTGNGNRGKIDEIRILIEGQIASFAASEHRIDDLEKKIKLLEERVFSTSLKVAGGIGVASVIIHYVLKLI